MSDNIGPPTSAHALERFDRWYSRLENALNVIAAIAIFFLMFVGVFQVVGRTLFGVAIYGYIDYIEQSTAIFAFLGVAYCQRFGGHIRMEFLLTLMPKRMLWIVETFAIIVALVIIAVLINGSYWNFVRAYELGDSTMDVRLPVWPGKLMVPLALATLWLRLALQLVGYLRLVMFPEARQIAVPRLHTPEEQARSEIEEALGRIERGRG